MINELLVIILLISAIECLGQTCLRTFFLDKNRQLFFIAGIIAYSIVCYLLVKSYNYKGMGLVNCIWSGISILFILFIGYTIFNEPMNNRDILGTVLIIAGIVLINWDGVHNEHFIFK